MQLYWLLFLEGLTIYNSTCPHKKRKSADSVSLVCYHWKSERWESIKEFRRCSEVTRKMREERERERKEKRNRVCFVLEITICIVAGQLLASLWVPNLATALRHMAGRTVLGGGGKTREWQAEWLVLRTGPNSVDATTCASLWVESTG